MRNVLLLCCDVQTPCCPCGRTIGSSKQNPDSDCLSSQSLNCTSKRSLLVAHMTGTRGENEPSNHHNYISIYELYILCLYKYIHIHILCMYDYERYTTHIWFGSANSCPHHGFPCAWLLNSESFLSDIGIIILYLEILGRLPGSEWLAHRSLNTIYNIYGLIVNSWRHLLLWDHPIMPSLRTTFLLFKFLQECNDARTW